MALDQVMNLRAADFLYVPEKQMVYGDTGRELNMTIIDYTIPAGSTAEVRIHRPDNTYYAIPCTISSQIVTCECDQMLTAVGTVGCTLTVTETDGTVSTFPFNVYVFSDNAGDPQVAQQGVSIGDLAEKLPDPPSTDGTYTLQATVASGVATYSWV